MPTLPNDDSFILDSSDDGPVVIDRDELVYQTLDDLKALVPAFLRNVSSPLRDAYLFMWGDMSRAMQARSGFVLESQASPRFAEGIWLDYWGILLNKPRYANELDSDYRARLLLGFDIVSPAAIKGAVNAIVAQLFPNSNIAINFQEPGIDQAFMAPATRSDPIIQNGLQQWTYPPSSVSVSTVGAGDTTSYTYIVVARASSGTSQGSSAVTITTANATLTSSNFNVITWSSVASAVSYDVYRTASGGTPSSTGKIGNTTSLFLNDTGLAGDSTSPPITNSSGTVPVWSAFIQPQIPISGSATQNQTVFVNGNFRLWANYPDQPTKKIGAFFAPASIPEFWIVIPGNISDDSLIAYSENVNTVTYGSSSFVAPTSTAYGYILSPDTLIDRLQFDLERRRAAGVEWFAIVDFPPQLQF